jgi:small subunit ribosomal protein S9
VVKNIAIGTGRRKTACARVFMREGTGKIVINGKDIVEYFSTDEQVRVVRQPLQVTSSENKFDILINVFGGGMNGQADACLHGISRALTQVDPDTHTALKANGFLTRDSRMVERKKYGQKGARRKFQFSKR